MADKSKRDWFATGDSDDEEQDYDSEVAEESRGKSFSGRDVKRRKLDSEQSDDESDDNDDADDNEADNGTGRTSLEVAARSKIERQAPQRTTKGADAAPGDAEVVDALRAKSAVTAHDKAKIARKLAKRQAKVSKTGVIYISRVPPFMKPHTLKHLLQSFAPSGLDRVFLTPEDSEAHKSRVKSGGNKKKLFLDGWVEFVSKREAKLAAETLNGKNIGGKKGGYYYDDVWNLKYLQGFKWRHLTEQIANENAEREARLRAETTRERKEAREFLRNVEQAKMLDGMQRKKKDDKGGTAEQDANQQTAEKAKAKVKEAMQFRQSRAVTKSTKSEETPSADTHRVLSKIF